jgi:hypothetical protein
MDVLARSCKPHKASEGVIWFHGKNIESAPFLIGVCLAEKGERNSQARVGEGEAAGEASSRLHWKQGSAFEISIITQRQFCEKVPSRQFNAYRKWVGRVLASEG